MSEEKLLRSLKRESAKSTRKRKKVMLNDGNRVEFGSKKHLNEMDRIILELNVFRSGLGKSFRKERYTVSRCIESMRFMRRKLKREGLRAGLLSEND